MLVGLLKGLALWAFLSSTAVMSDSDDELRSRSGGSASPRKKDKRSSSSAASRVEGRAAPLPSDEPPWLSAVLRQANSATVKSIEKKLGKRFDRVDQKLCHISDRQQATEEKLEEVSAKQNKFEIEQAELRLELRQLKAKQLVDQSRPAAFGGGASSSNASTTVGPVPLSERFPQFNTERAKAPLDKAEFLVGGWQQSLRQVIEADIKQLVAQIPGTGKIQAVRIPVFNNRANIAFIRFEPTQEQTSLQLAWVFKKGLDKLSPKPTSTGAGKPLWSKPNVPLEDRPAARVINRAKKFLHTIREEAGLPLSVEEFGHPTPWMEANYKQEFMQITLGSVKVATFNLDDDTKAEMGHTEWIEDALTSIFSMKIEAWNITIFKDKWKTFVAATGPD